jgi:hypothetical protein
MMPPERRDSIRIRIQNLHLPEAVIRIFDGERVHSALSYRAQAPYYSLTSHSGLDPTFVPFWECVTTVSGFSGSKQQFQRVGLEAPSEPLFSGSSFRSLFCDLVISLWEDEIDDTSLQEIATTFEMPPIGALLQSIANHAPVSSDWDQWKMEAVGKYSIL